MRKIHKEQFASCIQLYGRLVFSVCLTFTRNYFDAEDLTQETFLAAFQNIDHFKGDHLKAYLTTIAANKCKDYLRRTERKNLSLTEEDEELLEDTRGSPEETILQMDSAERVHTLCCKLKEPYKTVALCYFVKNKKLSEIAKATGQSLKTLQTQLYRAKTLLRTLWEEDERCCSMKKDI